MYVRRWMRWENSALLMSRLFSHPQCLAPRAVWPISRLYLLTFHQTLLVVPIASRARRRALVVFHAFVGLRLACLRAFGSFLCCAWYPDAQHHDYKSYPQSIDPHYLSSPLLNLMLIKRRALARELISSCRNQMATLRRNSSINAGGASWPGRSLLWVNKRLIVLQQTVT